MVNQAIPLLGNRIVFGSAKQTSGTYGAYHGCQRFVFMMCIDQLSTCSTKMLTVLSVGYGWQYPFQGVYDLFEIMKCWCLVFLDSQCQPGMGIVLCLFPTKTETAWSSSFDIEFWFVWCCLWMTLLNPLWFCVLY